MVINSWIVPQNTEIVRLWMARIPVGGNCLPKRFYDKIICVIVKGGIWVGIVVEENLAVEVRVGDKYFFSVCIG